MNRKRVAPLAGLVACIGLIFSSLSTVHAQAITEDFLAEQAAKVEFGDKPGSFLIAVFESDGTVTYTTDGENPDGAAPVPTDPYRIGSNTKIFTSALVLTLVDSGDVDLDAPAADYITRVDVPERVTVRQLLNHTSGIYSYTDLPDFESVALAEPERRWTPEEIITLIADQPNVAPGADFSYSNTNFIYLGILIEEITDMAYHELLRERIIDPLDLSGTWLDVYQSGPEPVAAYQEAPGGFAPIEYDYTSIATLAWSAGGIVSNAPDLDLFMTALFDGAIISDEALAEMTDTAPWDYGLGLMSTSDVAGVYGHDGGIPGYHTLLAHSPETGRTAFWAITNESVDFFPSVLPIFEQLAVP